jgi:hypothetical protein
MALKDLKQGDKIYAVYNYGGQLYCDHIYECIIKKVITKDFVTRIYVDDDSKGVGKRAVGYYLGPCAVNENYFFVTTDSRLKETYKREKGWIEYHDILHARDRLMKLITEGK